MAEAQRRFLFLQGLPGDFFWRLATALRQAGCGVSRINFNGGDQFDWGGAAINYRGTAEAWPQALEGMILEKRITDIVLFGDCRPMHRMAMAVAAALDVVVHVFEEGYVRPDWVTIERGGVNGHSPLPRDPDWYRAVGRALPALPAPPALGTTLGRRGRETVLYQTANILLRWSFPNYRTHRPWGPLTEGYGWVRRWARQGASHKRSKLALQAMAGRPYFLFAMQLDSDYQIRVHSPFAGMGPVIDQVIGSFARHAPSTALLLVKEHPLDNGLQDWRRAVAHCAAAHDVAARVVFCDVGDIDALVRSAEGLVTVNSTTGTLGLAASVPVIALGRAVYALPGLTHQGGLDCFWSAPQAPDAELFDCFQRVLADRCMVRGGFYSEEGLSMLIAAAVPRMLQAPGVGATAQLALRAELALAAE